MTGNLMCRFPLACCYFPDFCRALPGLACLSHRLQRRGNCPMKGDLARVAELVDAAGLGPAAERCGGSSPFTRTMYICIYLRLAACQTRGMRRAFPIPAAAKCPGFELSAIAACSPVAVIAFSAWRKAWWVAVRLPLVTMHFGPRCLRVATKHRLLSGQKNILAFGGLCRQY